MMAGMVTVSVLYPKISDSHFDHAYYVTKHIPLVKARWGAMGLEEVVVLRGDSTLDGGDRAWELIGLLTFSSAEQQQAAFTAHGAEIIADVPNFTNIQPMIQVNTPVAV